MPEIGNEEEMVFEEIGATSSEPIPLTPERSMDILVATGEPLETSEEAKASLAPYYQDALREVLSSAEADRLTLDEVQAKAIELSEKQRAFEENPDVVLEQAALVNNPIVSSAESNLAVNIQRALEEVEAAITEAEEENSTVGNMLNFLDRELVRAVVNPIEAFTERDTRSTTEIMSRSLDDPKDFLTWFRGYLEERKEEGVFRSGSISALEALKEEVGNLGFDPNSGFKKAFSLIDLPTIGTVAAGAKVAGKGLQLTSIIGSKTTVGRVTALKGEKAGEEAAETILKKGPDPETVVGRGDATQDLSGSEPVRANNSSFAQKLTETALAKEIDQLDRKGAFGRSVTKEKIAEAAGKIIQDIRDNTTNVVRSDAKIVNEGLGNWLVSVRLGKAKTGDAYLPIQTKAVKEGERTVAKLADGTAVKAKDELSTFGETTGKGTGKEGASKIEYKVPPSVKRAAEKLGPTAKVVQLDPADASKGYVIEVTERVSTLGLQDKLGVELNLKNDLARRTVGKLFNNRLMAGAALRDNRFLTTLAQLGQGGRAVVRDIVRPYEKSIKALDSKGKFTLNAVYAKLRDGEHAHVRTRYTDEEFFDEYRKLHPDGAEATKKELDAYHDLATVEETAYLIETTNVLQRFLSKGYNRAVEVAPGVFTPAKRITRAELKDSDIVLDVEGRVYGRPNDEIVFGDLADDIPVWKLDQALPTGQSFVVNPTNARLIDPTDVMGYNPGGRRINPNAKYFLVIGGQGKRVKALLSTFSETDAKVAKDQMRVVVKAINEGSSDIDEIIKNNNDWNPDIQSKAQFDELAFEQGWVKNRGDQIEGDVAYRARDGEIIGGDLDNADLWANTSAEDYIQNDMRRQDKVLMDFGGGKTYNIDPVSSTFAQFGDSVFTYTNKAYTQNAMVGWVKAALPKDGVKRSEWFKKAGGVSESDYETLFRNAEVTGTDEFAVRMRELRNITLRRLNMQDEPSRFMEQLGTKTAEYIFDGKIPFGIGKGKKLNFLANDPTNTLLRIGFQSSFGFMNISQFVMQGLHATTIMAISPKYGLNAAAMVFAQRGLLGSAKTPEAYKEGVKRLAKHHSLTEETAEELLEYIRTSGRHIVAGDAIEAGTGISWNISGWRGNSSKYNSFSAKAQRVTDAVAKGLDVGLYPFNAGERLSRLTAINTAFLEFKAKYPNVSASSDFGRQFITSREQTLTFNMTTADRAMVQSSLMKVPTQWLSYSFRSMEAVFVGRGLTKMERGQLFFMMAPLYGLTGFGAGNAADYVGEKLGFEPGGSSYVGLKYGFFDGISHALGGQEGWVGLGTRLAPIGAFLDTYEKIFEEETIGAIGGPSGEIVTNIGGAVFDALADLAHGRTALMTEDLIKVLRQPSGLNNPAKFLGIINNGMYRSKSGVSVGDEMDIGQALMALAGFTPGSVQEIYERKGQVYNDKKSLSKFRKEISQEADTALRYISEGDEERGRKMISEISAKIATSGFSFKEMVSLRRSALSPFQKDFQKMYIQMFKDAKNTYATRAFRKLTKNPEENN
jgi:hypothetical protein